jgi:molybdopterin molybdotransferase
MLSVDAALARILAHVGPAATEEIPLAEAHGRVLAADIAAPRPLPPWPASAMDGFAVRSADVPGALRVVETVPAGKAPTRAIGPGEATRVLTGAPVPDGADAVVMVEDTRVERVGAEEIVHIAVSASTGAHVRGRGSEVPVGAAVLPRGSALTAGGLGALAALGVARVPVARRPRVAILSTGDELVQPGEALGAGQIHASNAVALAALVREAGGEPHDLGVARDTPEALAAAFKLSLAYDVVVSTGGVSVGDFDYVKDVLVALGVRMDFWKVAMKPGKPLAFGSVVGPDGRGTAIPVFGLPGNPVSCMVNFLQFLRPFLRMHLGDPAPFLPVVEARLVAPLRRAPGRPEFVRVQLTRDVDGAIVASVAGPQGSASVLSMSGAHGFALLPADVREVSGPVRVQVFDPGWDARAAMVYGW